MKTLKLAFLFSLFAFTACNNDEFYEFQSAKETEEILESRSLESVEEDFEYPLYHVVYDPTTEMLNITLDPQYVNYDPGIYTHITFTLSYEAYTGYTRRYYGAFPIKGRCWADMYYANIGEYEMCLEINGVVFNRPKFSIPTPVNNHTRTGNIIFQSATFGN